MGGDLRHILRLLFGTTITPRGATAGQIVGRKLAKRVIRSVIHDREEKHRKHAMETGALAEILEAGTSRIENVARPTGGVGIASLADDVLMLRAAARKTMKGQVRKGIKRMEDKDDEDKKAEAHPAFAKLTLLNAIAKMADLEKDAPFKSEAQRRKFYAMKSRGEISGATVKKWESHTPKGKKLPERVHKKSAGLLEMAPLLTLAPGKSGLSRLARGVGWGSIPAIGAVEGMKAPPPSHTRTASAVDRLLELTKEASMFKTLKPGVTAKAEKMMGDVATKGRALSGAAAIESPATAEGPGSGHINRPPV